MTLEKFDPSILRTLRTEIDAALEVVGEKYGIILKGGNAKYTAQNFTMKIEGSVVSSDGTEITRDAVNFQRYAGVFGFQPDDLGRAVKLSDGKTYTISGLRPSAPKRPILLRDARGRDIIAMAAPVLRALGRNAAADAELEIAAAGGFR